MRGAGEGYWSTTTWLDGRNHVNACAVDARLDVGRVRGNTAAGCREIRAVADDSVEIDATPGADDMTGSSIVCAEISQVPGMSDCCVVFAANVSE
jgi:hypothetical protein